MKFQNSSLLISPVVSSVLCLVLVFPLFHSSTSSSIYATLYLKEWLTEFENCNVYISNLNENIWDFGNFEYPLRLANGNEAERSKSQCQVLTLDGANGTGRPICFNSNTNKPFSKRIFCTVNALIFPLEFKENYFKSADERAGIKYGITPTCSNPVYVSHDPPTQYKWTSCILLLVLPGQSCTFRYRRQYWYRHRLFRKFGTCTDFFEKFWHRYRYR